MKGYGRGLYQQENLKKCMSSIFSKAIKEAGLKPLLGQLRPLGLTFDIIAIDN